MDQPDRNPETRVEPVSDSRVSTFDRLSPAGQALLQDMLEGYDRALQEARRFAEGPLQPIGPPLPDEEADK